MFVEEERLAHRNRAQGRDLLSGRANSGTDLFRPLSSAAADQLTAVLDVGIDALNFAGRTTDIVVNFGLNSIQPVHVSRTARLNSNTGLENARGGTGDDALPGSTISNRLMGGNGDNVLVGLESRDMLEGGSGRDILIGSPGLHVITGRAGEDVLIAEQKTSIRMSAALILFESRRSQPTAMKYASPVCELVWEFRWFS
jgi:Ca2+-binding RTX toxin-like protein